eukprot:3289646-Rhodomonas_salina.1
MTHKGGHNVVRSVTIVSYAASGEVYAVAGYSASAYRGTMRQYRTSRSSRVALYGAYCVSPGHLVASA